MIYRLVLGVLGACVLGGLGCESKQTVALDEPLTPTETVVVVEEKKSGGFWPWEWARPGDSDEIEEVEITYVEDEPRKGPLESMAFWTWGDDDGPDPITKGDVLGNMSPELKSTARTPDEVDLQISRTIDTNGRTAWDDLLNIFLLDKPTRLTLYPVP